MSWNIDALHIPTGKPLVYEDKEWNCRSVTNENEAYRIAKAMKKEYKDKAKVVIFEWKFGKGVLHLKEITK